MNQGTYRTGQLLALLVLRFCIGWYLFYQGLQKYYTTGWTSKGFLQNSWGPLEGMFQAMADSPGLVKALDFLNLYGQLAIGLGLILGIFSRVASMAGVVMVALYYLAAPPFSRWGYSGTELVVNNNLILVFALLVLFMLPTSRRIGLDRLVLGKPRY